MLLHNFRPYPPGAGVLCYIQKKMRKKGGGDGITPSPLNPRLQSNIQRYQIDVLWYQIGRPIASFSVSFVFKKKGKIECCSNDVSFSKPCIIA